MSLLGQDPRNWDYTQALGFNPLPGADDPEFGGKVPTDSKGYARYRQKTEQSIEENLGMCNMMMRVSFNCEDRLANGTPIRLPGQKKEHTGCSPVCACNHVIHHDMENPDSVHFVPISKGSPLGYYLCGICYKSMCNYRLDIGKEVSMKCSRCVLDAIMKMEQKKPGRLINHLAD